MKVLVGVTGSVATVKLPELVRSLLALGHEVQVVKTEHAGHFFKDEDISPVLVFSDKDEWSSWAKIGDPVLHIELRRWADILVIAPLDANTLAKLANGLSDNLLTCIIRAWDVSRPILLCPAMNTFMWDHPFTQQHLGVLLRLPNTHVLNPQSKKLACGDIGTGGLAAVSAIVEETQRLLESSNVDRSNSV